MLLSAFAELVGRYFVQAGRREEGEVFIFVGGDGDATGFEADGAVAFGGLGVGGVEVGDGEADVGAVAGEGVGFGFRGVGHSEV